MQILTDTWLVYGTLVLIGTVAGFFISRFIQFYLGHRETFLSAKGLFSVIIFAFKIFFDMIVMIDPVLLAFVGGLIPPFNGANNPNILLFLIFNTIILFLALDIFENTSLELQVHESYLDALFVGMAFPLAVHLVTLEIFPYVWTVGLTGCINVVLSAQLILRLFTYVKLDYEMDQNVIPIIGGVMGIAFFGSLSLFIIWFGIQVIIIIGIPLTILFIFSIVQKRASISGKMFKT
ncbi:MAG: hypothetical protein ACFFCZ_20590 [Promethearchaeota archaeon]